VPSQRSFGERKKKKKKETSAVKYNTSGHYRGRRYKKTLALFAPHMACSASRPCVGQTRQLCKPRTSTIKHNAATNQIVVFVKVDETFTTIRLSRSSEVRVKVTLRLKV